MRIRFLGVLGIVVLAGACKSTVVPPEFLVSATIAPTSFHVGDTALITVTYTNESSVTEPFDWTDCPDQWVAESGSVIWAPNQAGVCQLILGSVNVLPAQQETFTYRWTGTTRTDTNGLAATLPPGGYSLQGHPQPSVNDHLAFHLAPAVSFQILP